MMKAREYLSMMRECVYWIESKVNPVVVMD